MTGFTADVAFSVFDGYWWFGTMQFGVTRLATIGAFVVLPWEPEAQTVWVEHREEDVLDH